MHPPLDPPTLVATDPRKRVLQERALVLRAVGVPYQVLPVGGAWGLLVPGTHAAVAREELRSYEEENAHWPPPRPRAVMRSRGVLGAVLYGVLLVLVHPFGQVGVAHRNLFAAGRMEGARVQAGEWWRTLTALTLHLDLSHLVGNLFFGALFGALASHSMGTGLAWLGAVLSGALGNAANAWLAGAEHRSVGASTAVFGLLGLMSAFEWIRREELGLPLLRRVAPLLGGGLLLGYLGMGSGDEGARVDIGAHVLGFGAGGLLGVLIGWVHLPDRLGRRGQLLAGLTALALVLAAWVPAWSRAV